MYIKVQYRLAGSGDGGVRVGVGVALYSESYVWGTRVGDPKQ